MEFGDSYTRNSENAKGNQLQISIFLKSIEALKKQLLFRNMGLQGGICGVIAEFITAPYHVSDEVDELEIEALFAFLGNVPHDRGAVQFEPELDLKIIDQAVAARHLDGSGVWNKIH